MTVNEGALDRTIRVILGIGLIAIALVGPRTPWGFIGGVPLLTGLAGFCPLYRLVGLSTCRPAEAPQGQA